MLDKSFLLGKLGDLAKAGVSTLAQAQRVEQSVKAHKKADKTCTPCAAKAAVAAARARVQQGKL